MKYTDQQREAIESRARSVCVEASAGSGKTRVLVDRIVDLIASDDADLDEIVAITFTEKAASEMKARLRNAFRQRAPEDDPEAMSQWRDNERRVDSARITTIHAFCAAILRESALWIGLDPDFAVMTGPQAQLLTDQIVDETLHDLLEDKDASLTRLATHIPLREISQLLKSTLGKRTLLERVREQFSLDDAESLKTRWQKAAELERGRRIDAAQHDATLRAYRARLAQAEGDCDTADEPREALRRTMINSLNELFALEEGEASARRTRTEGILSELSAPNVRGKPKLWANRSTYKAVSDDQKEIRELAQKYLAIPNPIPAIEEAAAQHVLDFDTTFRCVRDAYQASKRAANALDYEDLIEALLVVLRKRTDFRQRIAGGIKHLLVDEFQDTDGTQLELVRLLVDEVGGPNLFIVGDAKQSIYLFRGAEVEVFQAEKSQAEHTILLEKNFRTVPEILHFSNDFFAVSGVLSAVETYVPMQPHRDSTGQPRIEFLLSSSGPDAAKKQSTEDYRRTEAKNIVARICDLCHGESPLQIKDEHSGVIHDACYGDIAILFQAMTEAHLYEEALRKAHIPYVLSSGATFYRQQEIIDVMNLLKLLVDPYDEYALLAFLRGPMGCLCDDEVFRLAQQGNLCTAFWSVSAETESDSPDSLRGARALIELLRERAELPVSELLRFMLAHTGYEAILHAQFRGVQKAANVPKLVRLAEEFGRGQHASLRAYVYYLEAMRAQSVRETDATTQSDDLSAVTLMSIHKSKDSNFRSFLSATCSGRMRAHTRSGSSCIVPWA
jgi:ATP-dependent helicase/nuclease subunit A